ncbi:hypothetical protein RJ641_023301 [Dillenia turbinata]|uniref:Uncharacterized protein n=1 Tax=Dillenia turbinata TaxID=194707 RepID=A0AAN8YVH7_9MAGN
MAASGDFKVSICKKEVVAAMLPAQEHWLPQSNLDLLLPPLKVGVFFCYKKPSMSFGSIVGVLKKSLSHVLVSYPALAGEIVNNSLGEPELHCNNHGVEFTEAYADIQLKHLNFYNPDQSVGNKLMPMLNQGVLSIQATRLECCGLVVAIAFDHRAADAYSANMFLISWAETAQSKPLSAIPNFRRSLLNPRRPCRYESSIEDSYMTISSVHQPNGDKLGQTDDHKSRIYYIPAAQINQLQILASANNNNASSIRTKLESFSGYFWKKLAESGAKEKNSKQNITKLGVVVDGRTRLLSVDQDNDINKTTPSSLSNYFGNVVTFAVSQKNVHDLSKMPLSLVAGEVHESIRAVTKEHFLGLIDWVEMHRPEPSLTKLFICKSNEGLVSTVSSGLRFPMTEVDFGWGKPILGSYYFQHGGQYVMPMLSPTANGDWIVYVRLLGKRLQFLESEAGDLLRPLTYHYLDFDGLNFK